VSMDMSGRILHTNLAYQAMVGYSAEELRQKTYLDFTPEKWHALETRIVAEQILPRGHSDVYEKEYRRKDGTVFPVELRAFLIQDAEDRPVAMWAIVRDITERVRAAERLREGEQRFRRLAEANARLLEQARRDAETKTTLLKEVNHRVQNNLAGVIGLLRAHERFGKGQAPSELSHTVDDIVGQVEGLALVHQMLSSTEWSPLPAGDLVSVVARFALKSLPPDKRVTLDTALPLLWVSPDQASSLALVLNELVTNTTKHALRDRTAARISIEATMADGEVRLTFRDDGPGYPAGVLSGEERGVGLYLVENLVASNLRGTVELRNCGGAVANITFRPPS